MSYELLSGLKVPLSVSALVKHCLVPERFDEECQ
jgi:hypothetical protein